MIFLFHAITLSGFSFLFYRYLQTVPVVSASWLSVLIDSCRPNENHVIRELYEAGSTRWGSDGAWWLRWLQFEIQTMKDYNYASQLYLRALRQLSSEDVDVFTVRWNQLRESSSA
jgi:hypothetical protein